MSPENDEGAGAGVAEGAGDGSGEAKMFSQEDVNRMMADHKRTLQSENAGLKDQITGLSDQWKEFQSLLSEVAGEEGDEGADFTSGDDGEADDDEVTKRLAWLQKKHQGEIDTLRGAFEQEKRLRIEADDRRLITERDSALQEALAANDVVSLEGGMKYFRDSLFYDEDGTKWKYKTKDGLTFDIKEGIQEELPDWLKKPSSTKGGSGSASALINDIDGKVDALKSAMERAQTSGDPNDVAVYQKMKRELEDLHAQQLAAQSGRR